MIKIYNNLLLLVLAVSPFGLFGQQIQNKDTLKSEVIPEVIIHGKLNKLQNSVHLNSEQISENQSSTLGETLSRISGVQNASFGPNVGLPMIRSLSGGRVKILSDNLGLNDLSGITPNINIDIDQDKLKGIDLSKGSSSVLYGGKAIGGAVNLKTSLIPTSLYGEKIKGKAKVEYGFNSGVRESLSIDGEVGNGFVAHLGLLHHKNEQIRIPGNTKPPVAYNVEAIDFDTTLQMLTQMNVNSENKLNTTLFPYISSYAEKYMKIKELSYNDLFTFKSKETYDNMTVLNKPNPDYVKGQHYKDDRYKPFVYSIEDFGPVEKGLIPNSHSRGVTAELGVNYISNKLTYGLGYQYSRSSYGIPGFAMSKIITHSHTHANGKIHKKTKVKFVPINSDNTMHLTRIQIELKDASSFFPHIKVYNLFQNSIDQEILGDKVANQFNSFRFASRLELHQIQLKYLKGVTGIDYQNRNMTGKGPQRYLPNNKTSEFGAFSSQQLRYKFLEASLGYRYDFADRGVVVDPTYKKGRGIAGGSLSDKKFELNQFNSMIKSNFWNFGYISASYNHSERAPEVNELYAGNKHFAIITEENGNDLIQKEIAKTYEIELGLKLDKLLLSFNYYDTYFKNYLYLGDTGVTRGGFLVKEWRAADTEIYGYESQMSYSFTTTKIGKWELSSYYDLVKNKDLSGNRYRLHHHGSYMPNMPTSRFGFATKGIYKEVILNLNLDHYFQQKYLAKHTNPEPAFPSYSLLSARIGHSLNLKSFKLKYYIYGNNLLNKDCRPHNSVLRYLAPLPGINIGSGLNVVF